MTEKKKTEAFLAAISYAGDVEAKRIKEEADRRAEERVLAAREEARAEAESRLGRDIARAEARAAPVRSPISSLRLNRARCVRSSGGKSGRMRRTPMKRWA